jgi:hypothetical protein
MSTQAEWIFRVAARRREKSEVPILGHVPVERVDGVDGDKKHPIIVSIERAIGDGGTYHKRKSATSPGVAVFGSRLWLRWMALSMMTGNAVAYFNAFARCCPPQPWPPPLGFDLISRWTLPYSIRHCRSRIMLGMANITGTTTVPPQLRSGLPVELRALEKNMHRLTNRSPSTLA